MNSKEKELQLYKTRISDLVKRREQLKTEMEAWYGMNKGRFPHYRELQEVDQDLSISDSRFKQLWDDIQSQS